MSKRRIRVTLGRWMAIVAGLGISAAVVTVVVLPRVRTRRERVICINNLRMIDAAKYQYGVESRGLTSDAVPTLPEVDQYMRVSKSSCPRARGTNCTLENSYSVNDFTSPPTCRICPEEHRLP